MGELKRVVLAVLLLAVMVVHCMGSTITPRRSLHFHTVAKYFRHMNLPRRVEGVNFLSTQSGNDQVIRAELIHRDHPDSPFSSSTSSNKSERFLQSVKRSYARQSLIANQMSSKTVGDSYLESPVSAGSGEYLMSIALGTPAQQFSAIVDTGSDLVWVQCDPCTACYAQSGSVFDPSKSSSYSGVACGSNLCQDLPVQSCGTDCQYQYTYGDQSSTTGDFAFETVSLGGSGIPKVAFGCGHSNKGTFSGAGGLVGLGQGPISLPSQISSTVPPKFSYCLVNLDASASQTSPLLFGNSAVSGGVSYTPIVSNGAHPTYYYVDLTGISVGGVAVTGIPGGTFSIDSSGNGGTIFDCGTTITMLTQTAYNQVLNAFGSSITYPTVDGSAYGLDLCYSVASVANPTVPTAVFHFQGADFQLSAANLFVFVDQANTVICLAMAASQGFSIIGNIQQMDHEIVYDRVANRIGFSSTTC